MYTTAPRAGGDEPPRIAVLIPCFNEAPTIAKVVRDYHRALPQAVIWVYDNNSSDGTAQLARDAGAQIRNEPLQGKGNVVRRMFADVEADIYVLVDGDDTYDAREAPVMISQLLERSLDMVTATRAATASAAYRTGHRTGNRLLTGLVAKLFGDRVNDMLSGYRVFSRRFVKTFPALSRGFEIETELTVHALELRMPIAEHPTRYAERPEGSLSKLNTFSDGFRIFRTILNLVRDERPLPFFGAIALMLAAVSIILAVPIVITFLETGLVPRLPTAILSTGLMLLSFLSLASGLILETVTLGRHEAKRMHYLSIPATAGQVTETQRDFDLGHGAPRSSTPS